MQFPITIGLHRSRILDVILVLAALTATAAILGFQCSPPVRTGLLTVVLVLTIQAWRSLTPTIKAIRLERTGDIFIALIGGSDFVQAAPKPAATIHPWLTIVRLATADGRTATLIAAVDSQNRADFRRLRMFMRWQANFSELSDDD